MATGYEEKIIKTAMARNGLSFRYELSERTGINDQTMRNRMRHAENIRLYELRSIADTVHMTDEELIAIVRGCNA